MLPALNGDRKDGPITDRFLDAYQLRTGGDQRHKLAISQACRQPVNSSCRMASPFFVQAPSMSRPLLSDPVSNPSRRVYGNEPPRLGRL